MSGIEIAGLVFGVVPIVVETLKSYSFVRQKLHTCRNYSHEVEEIAARLTSAQTNFNNEIQLLRRCLKFKAQVNDLGDDVDSALEESYDSCITTIGRIKGLLDKMRAEMVKFDELLEKKSQVEQSIGEQSLFLTYSQGRSIRKLRTIVKVAFNESKYSRLLSRLCDRNSELSAFRLQIEALKQPDHRTTGICIQHKPLPAKFCAVQLASRQLHTALKEAWSCDDAEQRDHHAKLCLDAEVAGEVQLDMAISCQEPHDGVKSR